MTLSHDEMVAEINSGHTVVYRGTRITDVEDVPSDNQIAIDTASALQTMAAQNPNLSNALVYKGVIDCSANPNYPAADAGNTYIISVAGKIGGASGVSVEVGDMLICKTDGVTAGTQAQKGAYWNIVQSNLVNAYFAGGTDVPIADGGTGASTAADARTNLGLGTLATQSGTLPVKATGAEVVTGTDDLKYVTPAAMAGSNYVVGPVSATDNGVARFDGTTGKLVQDSSLTVGDNGKLTIASPIAGDTDVSRRLEGQFLETGALPAPASHTVTRFKEIYTLTANSTGFYYGMEIDHRVAGAFNIGGVFGFQANPWLLNTGTVGDVYGIATAPVNGSASSVNNLFGMYVLPESDTGTVGTMTSFYSSPSVFGGTTTNLYGFYAGSPSISGGAVTNSFGAWIGEHTGATNNYAFWYDSPGVFRIKGDGVMAHYNPTFTKYTPGAVNYERVVQQWNSDVLEYGPEKGGTGTLRGMRLIGASLEIAALVAANQSSPTGKFNVMADANGKLYVSNAAN